MVRTRRQQQRRMGDSAQPLNQFFNDISTGKNDHELIESVVAVIGDIISNPELQPELPLIPPLVTVGDYRALSGFYKDPVLVFNIANIFQARQAHVLAKHCGVDLSDPASLILFAKVIPMMDSQIYRCVITMIEQSVAKYGDINPDPAHVLELRNKITKSHEQAAVRVDQLMFLATTTKGHSA